MSVHPTMHCVSVTCVEVAPSVPVARQRETDTQVSRCLCKISMNKSQRLHGVMICRIIQRSSLFCCCLCFSQFCGCVTGDELVFHLLSLALWEGGRLLCWSRAVCNNVLLSSTLYKTRHFKERGVYIIFAAAYLQATFRQNNCWKPKWKTSLQRVFPSFFSSFYLQDKLQAWIARTHTHAQQCHTGTRQHAISSLCISNLTARIAPASPRCVKVERS